MGVGAGYFGGDLRRRDRTNGRRAPICGERGVLKGVIVELIRISSTVSSRGFIVGIRPCHANNSTHLIIIVGIHLEYGSVY